MGRRCVGFRSTVRETRFGKALVVKKMMIKIKDLKMNEPTPLTATYDAQLLDLEFEDLHYQKKISLSGTAERTDEMLRFYGNLQSEIEQICNRCLEPVVHDLREAFDFTYDIRNKETIDATVDLRDVLLLTHPDQFLCTRDCRGICAHCGVNLNRERCRCKTSHNHNDAQQTWTPLKKLLHNKKAL